MREKTKKLVACPIARSSNDDAYNDICKATGQPCPYYVDEGMSVCKSKTKCLIYFSKRLSKVNFLEVVKLIISNTKSRKEAKTKYTNTLRRDKEMQEKELEEIKQEENLFMEELEEALKTHEGSDED